MTIQDYLKCKQRYGLPEHTYACSQLDFTPDDVSLAVKTFLGNLSG